MSKRYRQLAWCIFCKHHRSIHGQPGHCAGIVNRDSGAWSPGRRYGGCQCPSFVLPETLRAARLEVSFRVYLESYRAERPTGRLPT